MENFASRWCRVLKSWLLFVCASDGSKTHPILCIDGTSFVVVGGVELSIWAVSHVVDTFAWCVGTYVLCVDLDIFTWGVEIEPFVWLVNAASTTVKRTNTRSKSDIFVHVLDTMHKKLVSNVCLKLQLELDLDLNQAVTDYTNWPRSRLLVMNDIQNKIPTCSEKFGDWWTITDDCLYSNNNDWLF